MGHYRVLVWADSRDMACFHVIFLSLSFGQAPLSLRRLPQQGPDKKATGDTPIEFQSHGLDYEAFTKAGITVMFAKLPPHIKDFNIVQITVTNGSLVSWTVRPSDFSFARQERMTAAAGFCR